MNRRQFLSTAAAAASPSALPAAGRRPNVVLIMADDLGFSDFGCYGGEISTPNINALAKGGVRFTQFYNTARCCPTRASLMTGLYPHQAGVGHMMDDKGLPGYRGELSRQAVTIAEALRPAGYRTLMAGKWHVTRDLKNHANWPRQRGFDRFFGTITGAGSFYDPVSLTRENTPIEAGKDFYYTDALSDQAVSYIDEYAKQPEPFFLYLAYTSPHWPLHALEADAAKYKGRYKDGWDALRLERHRRMIGMGLVDKRWPLTPRDASVPAWNDAGHKAWQQRRMEVYAAQVETMDRGIGRVMASLRRAGVDQDTLVLLLADNGGCAEELGPNVARNIYVPKQAPDGRPMRAGNLPEIMPGGPADYQSYGVGWANASNTPFRLYKHWVHEGGISSPLIAHWPSATKKTNTITHQPGHLIDIMATCLDVAGAKYPQTHAGNPITPLEGKSLRPVIEGGRRAGHPEIYWEHEGNRAVRQQNWKLVSRHPGRWELYDLEADRTELNDLSAKHPGKATELVGKWDAWAKRANVEEWEVVRSRKAL
jgi:arylsulfatase